MVDKSSKKKPAKGLDEWMSSAAEEIHSGRPCWDENEEAADEVRKIIEYNKTHAAKITPGSTVKRLGECFGLKVSKSTLTQWVRANMHVTWAGRARR